MIRPYGVVFLNISTQLFFLLIIQNTWINVFLSLMSLLINLQQLLDNRLHSSQKNLHYRLFLLIHYPACAAQEIEIASNLRRWNETTRYQESMRC